MEFLKQNHFDVGLFFTKSSIANQYIIISQFLLDKYNIELYINPLRIGIRDYVDITSNKIDDIFTIPNPYPKDKYDNMYILLICKAFQHIQNTPF